MSGSDSTHNQKANQPQGEKMARGNKRAKRD